MGKKMKLPSLLHNKPSSSSWPCHQPRTLSFRTQNDAAFKTINAAYLDTLESSETSFFTVSPDSGSFSTASEQDSRRPHSLDSVIRGLRSDRLFFEPDETSSILEARPPPPPPPPSPPPPPTTTTTLPFKDSVVMSVDSQDPYVDFRRSMEEMVEAQCVKDWEGLQELLCWYLKVNGKTNHGYIVGAFVDLLVASSSSSSSSSFSVSSSSNNNNNSQIVSPSSPLSFYSSSLSSSCSTRCVSCLEAEVVEVHNDIATSTPTSSFLLQQVREDQPSSSSSSSYLN
ncbi:transcription repressor OFP13-like [Glycine soja]|uniref:Transcription repressor n=1 Tax=Glycine soja TaxID=3848 RepID=A0A445LEG2_GLYSO|nr:transcription repressor OFP13-like [Glycine soja]RZC21568.1 Transcription repressor OFP13 [Glycine soja]